MTAVWTAYPTYPLLAFLHPPIECAARRPRGCLDLDGRVDLSAIGFAVLTRIEIPAWIIRTQLRLWMEEGHARIKHRPQDLA
ncbi:MAG TPA: hypothetical protein VHR39_11840 [Propionibacteriaceae bacterium]|nr:hypothetical protein [Propionibacteriaceae bacterium]